MDEYEIGDVVRSGSGRLYRYLGGDDPDDPVNWEEVEEEGGKGFVADVASQGLRGLGEAGYSSVGGIAQLVGADKVARAVDRQRQLARDYYGEPEGIGGTAAAFGGRVLGEGALALAPGAALRGGARAVGAASKVGPKLSALLNVGVDVASEAGERPEDSTAGFLGDVTGIEALDAASRNPYTRALVGVPFGQLVGEALKGGARGAQAGAAKLAARRGSQAAAQQAGQQAAGAAKVIGLPAPPTTPRKTRTRTPISEVEPEMVDDFENIIEAGVGETPATLRRAKVDIEELKRTDPDFVNRPTTEEATAEAAKLVDLDELLGREGFTPQTGAEARALVSAYAENAAERADLERQLATEVADSPQAKAINAKLDKLAGRGRKIISQHATGGSTQGREFRLRRVENEYLAGRNLDPLTWAGKAKRALGGDVPQSVLDKIDELIAKKDRKGLADLISGLGSGLKFTERPSAYIAELVKPALLSGLTSITRPLVGNPLNLAFRVLNTPTTALWNKAVAAAAGVEPLARVGAKRAVQLGKAGAKEEVAETIEGGVKNLTSSLKGAYDLTGMRDLKPVFGLRKTAKRVANAVKLGKYTPEQIEATGVTPLANMFRNAAYYVQGGLDAPYRGAATAIATEEVATNWARVSPDRLKKYLGAQGLPPSEIDDIIAMTPAERVARFKADPTPQMELEIQEVAGEATYQSESVFHKGAQLAKRGAQELGAIFAGEGAGNVSRDVVEGLMPLTKTGGGIAQAAIETTPLGAVAGLLNLRELKNLVKAVDPDAAKIFETQRKAVRQLGRSAGVTTGLGIALGYKWMKDGKMAGDIPEEQTERAQYFNENKQPYAVKAGDRWVPPTLFQPFATSFVVGAMLAEQDRTPGGKAIAATGAPAARTIITESPFYRGAAAGAASLAKKGRAQGQTVPEALGQTLVPTAFNAARKFVDPVQRRREGFVEEAMSKIPGLSERLEPQVAPTTGEDLQSEYTLGGRIGEVLDPTGSAPMRTERDPLLAEIARVGAAVGNPNQDKKGGETPKEYTARLREGGKVVQQVMSAFITGDDPDLLDEHGVYEWGEGDLPTGFERYQELKAGEQTPEALAEQAEILEDAVSRVRSRATRLKRAAAREGQ